MYAVAGFTAEGLCLDLTCRWLNPFQYKNNKLILLYILLTLFSTFIYITRGRLEVHIVPLNENCNFIVIGPYRHKVYQRLSYQKQTKVLFKILDLNKKYLSNQLDLCQSA